MRANHIIVAALMVFALCGAALATTVMKVDLRILYEKSEMICTGKVKSLEGRQEMEGKTIATYVTIKPITIYKGKIKKEILVRVPGGSAGGRNLMVFGAPVFAEGERVFLILEKDYVNEDAYRVSGYFQGRYLLFQQGDTTYAVMDSGQGGKIFDDCDTDRVECMKVKGMKPLELKTLTNRIRTWMDQDKENKKR